MASSNRRIYTTPQIADRIGELTGHRPLESTLRANATTGSMPAPLPEREERFATWDADEIDAWLIRRNPRRVKEISARISAAAASGDPEAVREEVRAARASGLSWTQIAAAIPGRNGTPISRQAAFKRFADL